MSQAQTIDDPLWPRASAWLAGERRGEVEGLLAVIGAPVRRGSITPGHCDLAPQAVRAALHKFSCYDIEADVELWPLEVSDYGDLPLADLTLEEAFEPLHGAVCSALDMDADAVVLLGGDNGVTRPGVRGLADSMGVRALQSCGLLTLDAHFDLRDLSNGLTNGNPVRALLADGLPGGQVVQIGIQPFANSRAYAAVARDAGITVVTMNRVRERGIEAVVTEALDYLSAQAAAIYVDFDMDVLDRAFAPATPGSRPGGLTPWELRRAAFLCGSHLQVRAADFVEVDPTKDMADATLLATGQCLLSFASGLVTRLSRGR
jgi:formiminoglutamase